MNIPTRFGEVTVNQFIESQSIIKNTPNEIERNIKLLTLFSGKTKEEIETLEAAHDKMPHLRLLQKELAKEITIRVHSEELYNDALRSSELFSIDSLEEFNDICGRGDFHDVIGKAGYPIYDIANQSIDEGINILNLLTEEAPIFSSKGEAKRLIQGGGLKINFSKVIDTNLVIDRTYCSKNQYIIIHKGKSNTYLLNVILGA